MLIRDEDSEVCGTHMQHGGMLYGCNGVMGVTCNDQAHSKGVIMGQNSLYYHIVTYKKYLQKKNIIKLILKSGNSSCLL